MVPRGSGVQGVNEGAPGRSGGVSIRVAITVLAGLWEEQREARGNQCPLGIPWCPRVLFWGSFGDHFGSILSQLRLIWGQIWLFVHHLGSDFVVCSSNYYYFVNNYNNYYFDY